MNEPRGLSFLQQALALDPTSSAGELLALRREFLLPADVIRAEVVDSEGAVEDFRARMLLQLSTVRQNFWRLDRNELAQRLSVLQSANHPETASVAARLTEVAQHREALMRLWAHTGVYHEFVRALAEIMVAPGAQANRLREREHSRMRPENNPEYESDQTAIQETVQIIHDSYPEVFVLEEAWLTDLLEHNAIEETEDKFDKSLFGIVMLVGLGATILTFILMLLWLNA